MLAEHHLALSIDKVKLYYAFILRKTSSAVLLHKSECYEEVFCSIEKFKVADHRQWEGNNVYMGDCLYIVVITSPLDYCFVMPCLTATFLFTFQPNYIGIVCTHLNFRQLVERCSDFARYYFFSSLTVPTWNIFWWQDQDNENVKSNHEWKY